MDVLDCDVLVIGGGGAGVAAAVAAAEEGAGVMLASKEPVGYGNTKLIGGVIAILPQAEGAHEAFLKDIAESAEGINNEEITKVLVNGSVRLRDILEDKLGVFLGRDEEGNFPSKAVIKAGGHSQARSLIIPGKGQALSLSLRGATAKYGIEILNDAMAASLLCHEGKVVGAVFLDVKHGKTYAVLSRAVILATGGCCWLYYPFTDVSRTTTGDGMSLALRAGVELRDMEQIQFIPFGITHPKSMMGILCGEPYTAGPRGKLLNKNGEKVLKDVWRKTRAEVSKAIILEAKKGNGGPHGGLFLDLQDNKEDPEGAFIYDQYTKGALRDLGEVVRFSYGEKAFHWDEPWEVYPTAHYSMGGVKVEKDGRTSKAGLWAVGEVTGGLHGANRLGSVSLTDIFVLGSLCGKNVVEAIRSERTPEVPTEAVSEELEKVESMRGRQGKYSPRDLLRRLQDVMWEKVGPLRDGTMLEEALSEIRELGEKAGDISVSPYRLCNTSWRDALELRFMLDLAECTALSALLREESRGSHLRTDYPSRDDNNWLRSIFVNHEKEGEITADARST
ncbi:MAG: FAD-binding protein [Thermodesulfobacteriota bacterium]|nr:FAD-binding protein [Thermodesulfobacteriota bacterium]